MSGVDASLMQPLRQSLSEVFLANIDVAPAELDAAPFLDPSRGQYNSTQILQYLKATFADPVFAGRRRDPFARVFLAISAGDLFVPVLTFVFGEAELRGNVAVTSYYRLQTERYGLPSNHDLLVSRLVKEARHELGHAYGLVHCSEPECVMRASTYVEDIDLKSEAFCDVCHSLLSLK